MTERPFVPSSCQAQQHDVTVCDHAQSPVTREWFVVFKRRSKGLARFCPGRFKHVLAFAPVLEGTAWVFVEFSWAGGSVVVVVSNDEADAYLGVAAHEAVILKVPAGTAGQPRWGLWCVPAIAHVVGVRSCALRPDGFFRDCLRSGGEIVIGEDHGQPHKHVWWRRRRGERA